MSVLLGLVFVVMFAYERRMYRLRRLDSAGPQGAVLLDVLEAEHVHSLRVLVPILLVSWVTAAGLVLGYPAVFVDGGWHVALGTVQALGLFGYLVHVWRFYLTISDRVVDSRAEWDPP